MKPNHSSQYTWAGRFSEPMSELVKRYTASVDFDKRMWRQDIRGSLAHARMLAKQGIISADDLADIERGIGLLVAEHGQVHAHRRMQRDVCDQVAEAAECIACQHVMVVRQRVRHVHQRACLRDDHDLGQRKGDSLPKLVRSPHRIAHPGIRAIVVHRPDHLGGVCEENVCSLDNRQLDRGRLGELLVDPAAVSKSGYGRRIRFGGAERGLV